MTVEKERVVSGKNFHNNEGRFVLGSIRRMGILLRFIA